MCDYIFRSFTFDSVRKFRFHVERKNKIISFKTSFKKRSNFKIYALANFKLNRSI